jgi:hypothetical protein
MPGNINSSAVAEARKYVQDARIWSMDDNLHSPHRRLIELRIEHADLDSLIDRCSEQPGPVDDLLLQRLKKRRLLLRDQISRLEAQLEPPEPA